MRQNSKSYIRKMHPRGYGEKSVEFALGGGEDLNTFIPEGFSLPYQKLIQNTEICDFKNGSTN